MKHIINNLFYIFFPLLVGFLSSLFSGNFGEFYSTLNKSILSPPGWVFGLVWSILFLLMGISYYLLKNNSKDKNTTTASFWYYLQLIINFFWSIIFFRFEAFTFAFIWLLLLLITVIVTFINFYKIYKPSAYLLIPYIIWIMFAGYLNLSIIILN